MKKYLILVIFLSLFSNLGYSNIHNKFYSKGNSSCKYKTIKKYLRKLKYFRNKYDEKHLIWEIQRTGIEFNLNCVLITSLLKIESNLNQNAVNPFTGEKSISRINTKVWRKEYKKNGMTLDKQKLSKDRFYSIYQMGYILFYYRAYFPKDDHWFARYNSGLWIYKLEYMARLEMQFKKMGIQDYFISYKMKRRMIGYLIQKYGWERTLSIYTNLYSKKERQIRYIERFKKRLPKKYNKFIKIYGQQKAFKF